MKKILIVIVLGSPFCTVFANECAYGVKNSCSFDSVCILTPPNTSKCVKKYTGQLTTISFPFKSGDLVLCDQGNLSPSTENHSYISTAYALDLKPSTSTGGKSILKAGIPGKAIVFNDCHTENDSCGAGFGNHLKILSKDGYMLLYAHMDRVFVNTGDDIKVGQIVGTMGMTGATGINNPHLHISMHYSWTHGFAFSYWTQTGYVPPSIPFKVKTCENNGYKGCVQTSMLSTAIQCLRTNSKSTKLFSGY